MDINMSTNNFQISGKVNSDGTSLIMKVPNEGHVTTGTLPLTEEVLAENLPTIFSCQCFNEANKNFREECKNTELGHLFEHIMLEYLCMEKLDNGHDDAEYEGRTNWETSSKGVFNIEIKTDLVDFEIIRKAFEKSVQLLGKILL
jgi:hypothetical protein